MNARILGRMEAVLELIEHHLDELKRDREARQIVQLRLERALTALNEFSDIIEKLEQLIRESRRDDILTPEQLANVLNVHPSTIRRMYNTGKLPGYRFTDRGMIRFDRDEALHAVKSMGADEVSNG